MMKQTKIDFFMMPRKYFLHGVSTFLLTLCGSVIYLTIAPRIYQSQAKLILHEKPSTSLSELGREISERPTTSGATPMATQEEIAQSIRVLEKAQKSYNAQYANKPEDELSLNYIRNNLVVETIPGTQILSLTFNSQDPSESANLLNIIAQQLIADNVETIRAEANEARVFLEVQIPRKLDQLMKIEHSISRFKSQNNLIALQNSAEGADSLEAEISSNTQAGLEDQSRTLAAQIKEISKKNQKIRRLVNSQDTRKIYQSVRVGQNEQLNSLRTQIEDLESQIDINRASLTEGHPILIDLRQKLDAAKQRYRQEINQNYGAVASDVATDDISQELSLELIRGELQQDSLQEKLNQVNSQIGEFKNRRNQFPQMQQRYAMLVRQRDSLSTTLESLRSKLDEARIAESQAISKLRILDVAVPATDPISPKASIVLALGTICGIMAAAAVVLLLDKANQKNYLDERGDNFLDAHSNIFFLPSLPEEAIRLETPESFLNSFSLVESYRKLIESMKYSLNGNQPHIVVSSLTPREGKSVVSSHLAAVAALLSKKTLLIDANLNQPTQHQIFGLASDPLESPVPHRSEEHLTKEASLVDLVQPTGIDNLSIIASGHSYAYPHELFTIEDIKALCDKIASQYDVVIIDTPSLAKSQDALALTDKNNKLLLVTNPNYNVRFLLEPVITDLTEHKVDILGIAVNGAWLTEQSHNDAWLAEKNHRGAWLAEQRHFEARTNGYQD